VTPEEALRLIEQGEGQTVEFKASMSAVEEGIDSLCAFANADGGTVFFGVRDDKTIVGLSVGANTLEELANKIARSFFPRTVPRIDEFSLSNRTILAITVETAGRGKVIFRHAPRRRSGRTNQQMSWDQVRDKISQEGTNWSDEQPRFEVTQAGVTKSAAIAEPKFRVNQASGDMVADIEWRIRGQFVSDWRQTTGSALDRTAFIPALNLPHPSYQDPRLGPYEIGFEIRFDWRGRVCHEIHRWHTPQRLPSSLSDWEIEGKILPPLRFEEPR